MHSIKMSIYDFPKGADKEMNPIQSHQSISPANLIHESSPPARRANQSASLSGQRKTDVRKDKTRKPRVQAQAQDKGAITSAQQNEK